jgi:hypothetical protein
MGECLRRQFHGNNPKIERHGFAMLYSFKPAQSFISNKLCLL